MIRLNKITILLIALAWYSMIWVVSSLPAESLSDLDRLNLDNIAHLAVYLILALLVNQALHAYQLRLPFVLFIYSLLLLSAALDEYHQIWIPNRMVSIYDMLANQAGLVIGLTIHMLYDRRKRS